MDKYLCKTPLLDYKDNEIQKTIAKLNLPDNPRDRILTIYNFVRDEIAFGYNIDDAICASKVLEDGYGQCNTKGTLFMALLRVVGIPCRMHGFTIDKKLQQGAMTGIVYRNAPQEIVHSWVEVLYKDKWLELEGFILDMDYLNALQKINPDCQGSFCGYGVATTDFRNPPVDWNENNTYIQKEGIVQDFGVFATPDDFFAKHSQGLAPAKQFLYRNLGRHLMNRNVRKIRNA